MHMITLPIDILESTLEYQNWGVNAVTISFFLSLVVTSITAWGLWHQIRTIWQQHSAKALSASWMSYNSVLHLVIITYGISINSAAVTINGLLSLLYFAILFGLAKFKRFTTANRIVLGSLSIALVVMIATPYKSLFFLLFAMGGLFSAALQPLEMWKLKSAAGLDTKLIGTLLFANIVWLAYGLAVTDWILISINAIAFTIFTSTLFLARTYTHATDRF